LTPYVRLDDEIVLLVRGALKMRDWKMRDWKYRHHVTGGGKCETGIIGTKLQGWKMQDWNYRHHLTGGGKCGTGKFGNGKSMERHVWHNLVLVAHMNTEKCGPT